MSMNTQAVSSTSFQAFLHKYWGWLVASLVGVAVVGWGYATNDNITVAVLASTIRQATPLVLGAMCGLIGERAGVINIGIEGQMLLSAFVAFLANVYTGNLFVAVLAGMLTGAVLGLLHAYMSVTLKIDQIIGGTVINILAMGLTGYFYTAGLTTQGKLQPLSLGPLAKIPLAGPVLFDNPPITYATIILVFVLQYVLFYTRWGLRTRAVGEHPRAADTVGINVFKIRYVNVILGGAIAGLAGAFLTLEAVGSFERGMTNGRGFVALAVMIFGRWTPIGSWGAALLFGLASALQTQLQFGGQVNIPHQFIGMLPYLLTIVVLAGLGGRTRAPAADGVPYEKE
jgi:simple sugar transport system permease protein